MKLYCIHPVFTFNIYPKLIKRNPDSTAEDYLFFPKEKNRERLYERIRKNFVRFSRELNLYIKNGVVPKAICEILPEGGSITSWKENGGQSNLSPMEKKLILPEFALGHLDTIGDREQYEKFNCP